MLFSRILSIVLLFLFTHSSYGLQLPKQGGKIHPAISAFEKLVVHYRYDKPDSAIYFAEKGLKLARHYKDEEGVASMLNQLGMIDDNSGKADLSKPKYLEALEIYTRLGNKNGIIKENIRLGALENRNGNHDRASAYFLYALKLSEQIKSPAGLMESNIYLAEVYLNQHKYNRAFKYLKRAEKISETLPFSSLKLNLYADLGTAYRETGDLLTSISYYEMGIAQSDFPEMMGLNISLTNGLAQVYAKSGEIEKAIALQKGALAKSRKISNPIREFVSLTALAESYDPKELSTSLGYLEQALIIAQNKNANKQVLEVLGKIADIQERKDAFKAAYLTRSKQYSIADSFYFKDISLKINNLQAQYELNKSEAKVQELRFLNGKQGLEKRIMLGITVAISVLLVVFAFYFFKIRNLNRLLNKSNTALTASNAVKDKLFSVLAHDLRAPLASVINLMDIINRNWLTEEEKTIMMSKLQVHCNASMETLNLLLRWGQMQIKGVMLNQTKILPAKVIQRNVSLLHESAMHKSIVIAQDVPDDLQVFCDADHLDFMMRNLISNAIKFTPDQGRINISVKRYDQQQVLFAVSDNGVGIENDRLVSIFEIDSESTNGTKNEKGTSLGLFICKEFIAANEGRLWVESKIGEGSTFYFTLKGVSSIGTTNPSV
jgi:signal transduction histidine kinase